MINLINYYKTNTPLIFIDTYECVRLENDILQNLQEFNQELPNTNAHLTLKEKGYSFFKLDPNKGWIHTIIKPNMYHRDLINALNFIKEYQEYGVFFIPNFHTLLNITPESLLIPTMIELAHTIVNKHVVMSGNPLNVPIELKQYITFLNYNLPTKTEIKNILKKFNNTKLSKQVIENIIDNAIGLSEYEITQAIKQSICKNKGKIEPRDIFEEKIKTVKKTSMLEYLNTDVGIKDIGGMDNLKIWAQKVSKVFHNRQQSQEYGIPYPKGCILFGISGSGKTLASKALANTFDIPLYNLNIGRLFSSLVGETEKNVNIVLKTIDALSPCCVLIDEAEKLLAGINSSGAVDSGVTARLAGTILHYLQEKTTPNFWIFTVNDITKLPPEMLRRGRFSALWFVDLPNQKEREEIFKIHIEKHKNAIENYEKINFYNLALQTPEFTGAEIEGVVVDAMTDAFFEDRKCTYNDIENVIKKTIPLAQTRPEEVKALREWAKKRAMYANKSTDNYTNSLQNFQNLEANTII